MYARCSVELLDTREDGKHRYRCPDCGMVTGYTNHPAQRVFAPCRAKAPRPGVGYHLTRFLAWFSFRESDGCNCKPFAAELDKLGPAGCRKDFRRLAKKLADKAAKKGMPFAGLAAAFALMRAIRAAEKTA